MPTPNFIEAKPLCLVEVKGILEEIGKRDAELNYRSKKAKDYLEQFASFLSPLPSEELRRRLLALNLVRLKEEHIAKIVDFLPKTVPELKIVLQAYPLSLPKKDQESIVAVVKESFRT